MMPSLHALQFLLQQREEQRGIARVYALDAGSGIDFVGFSSLSGVGFQGILRIYEGKQMMTATVPGITNFLLLAEINNNIPVFYSAINVGANKKVEGFVMDSNSYHNLNQVKVAQ